MSNHPSNSHHAASTPRARPGPPGPHAPRLEDVIALVNQLPDTEARKEILAELSEITDEEWTATSEIEDGNFLERTGTGKERYCSQNEQIGRLLQTALNHKEKTAEASEEARSMLVTYNDLKFNNMRDWKSYQQFKGKNGLRGGTNLLISEVPIVRCVARSLDSLSFNNFEALGDYTPDENTGFTAENIIIGHMHQIVRVLCTLEPGSDSDWLQQIMIQVDNIKTLCFAALGSRWTGIWNHYARQSGVAEMSNIARTGSPSQSLVHSTHSRHSDRVRKSRSPSAHSLARNTPLKAFTPLNRRDYQLRF